MNWAEGVLTIVVDFDGLDPDIAARIGGQLRGAGLAIDGTDHVRIRPNERIGTESGTGPESATAVIGVGGAKGGVGRSTVTIALARRLQEQGYTVGIFDADVESPDISGYLGIDGPVIPSQSGRPAPIDANGIEVMSIDLVAGDRPISWRGAMVHDVLETLLANADWSERDVVLVDLPAGVGDVHGHVCHRIGLDGAIAITIPTEAGYRGLERTLGLFDAFEIPVLSAVTNMTDRYVGPGSNDPHPTDGKLQQIEPVVRLPVAENFQTDGTIHPNRSCPRFRQGIDTIAVSIGGAIDELGMEEPDRAIDLSRLPDPLRIEQAELEIMYQGTHHPILLKSEGDIHELHDQIEREEITATKLPDGRVSIEYPGNDSIHRQPNDAVGVNP